MLFVRAFHPGAVIGSVVQGHGLLGDRQGPEGVNHDGVFVGGGFANTALVGAGVGSVRNTSGVQRDLTRAYIVSAHKIPIHVVQNFFGINVGVVVRRRNGEGVVIVEAWAKTANHKAFAFKGLVNRGRLMNAAGDGFKIIDTETVREIIPVVAHYIKGVTGIGDRMQDALFADFDFKGALGIVGFQLGGEFVIPFAIGRMFQQLPEPVAVALGGVEGIVGFQVQKPVVVTVKFKTMNHPPGNQEVIAFFEGNVPQLGSKGARSAVDKNQFIGVRVFVKIILAATGRGREAHGDLFVDKKGNPAVQVIAHGLNLKSLVPPRCNIVLDGNLRAQVQGFAHGSNDSGAMQMVHQGRHAVKTNGPKQLFVVEFPVGLAELGMAFGGDLSQAVINGHRRRG